MLVGKEDLSGYRPVSVLKPKVDRQVRDILRADRMFEGMEDEPRELLVSMCGQALSRGSSLRPRGIVEQLFSVGLGQRENMRESFILLDNLKHLLRGYYNGKCCSKLETFVRRIDEAKTLLVVGASAGVGVERLPVGKVKFRSFQDRLMKLHPDMRRHFVVDMLGERGFRDYRKRCARELVSVYRRFYEEFLGYFGEFLPEPDRRSLELLVKDLRREDSYQSGRNFAHLLFSQVRLGRSERLGLDAFLDGAVIDPEKFTPVQDSFVGALRDIAEYNIEDTIANLDKGGLSFVQCTYNQYFGEGHSYQLLIRVEPDQPDFVRVDIIDGARGGNLDTYRIPRADFRPDNPACVDAFARVLALEFVGDQFGQIALIYNLQKVFEPIGTREISKLDGLAQDGENCLVHSFEAGELLLFSDRTRDLLRFCRMQSLHTLIETNPALDEFRGVGDTLRFLAERIEQFCEPEVVAVAEPSFADTVRVSSDAKMDALMRGLLFQAESKDK
jgi:hypothetical protein